MKKIILGLIISAALGSCSKDDIEKDGANNADGQILTKVQYVNGSTKKATTIVEVQYDAEGVNISAVKTFRTDETPMIEYTKVERNSSKKINKIEGIDKLDGNEPVKWEFIYDDNGNITESKKDFKQKVTTYYFTYDASNRVLTSMNDDASYTYHYEGTSKNPNTATVFNNYTFQNTTTKYVFDDKKNPYSNAGNILFYMNSGEFFENNLKEVDNNGMVIKYNYEYNSLGYPTTKRDANGGGLNFIYK